MTFDYVVRYYGFETDNGLIHYRRISTKSLVVIEKKYCSDTGDILYDFYKISETQKTKIYESNINEFFLIRRVTKFFGFLRKKENERKKTNRLQKLGFNNEYEFQKDLFKRREKEKKEKEFEARMGEANLILHKKRDAKKYCEGQMKMNL